MLQVGIVGLPNVGKSSLFNALTAAGAPAENYPFCTVEPNVGTVAVPDSRLPRIHTLVGSAEMIPAFIRFVDIAGLVRGASQGEGLGNQFLGQIREVDAIAHVLRCFQDPGVVHVMGSVHPMRDMEIVEMELVLADLETVGRRLEKVEKKARSGEKDAIRELAVLERLSDALSRGRSARSLPLTSQEHLTIRSLNLLTMKPVILVANVAEEEVAGGNSPFLEELSGEASGPEGTRRVVPLSAAMEADLALLEPEDRRVFMEDLGLEKAGLHRVIGAAYEELDLITFFSTGEKQTRAWPVTRGTRAPDAAGVIHTDFQRGFIRAEAIGFREFEAFGSMKAARDEGAIRSEGKEYEVRDGDILFFRFNV
jgi:ribosome-binding ATPase